MECQKYPTTVNKLIRITTVPLSLEKLLEGQLRYMKEYYEVTAVSADRERLQAFGKDNGISTYHVELTREITPWADLKALSKMYWYFRKEKPLMVHTHTPKAGIIGMLAAKLAGVPLRLHTVAGMPLMETSGSKRKILEQVEKLTYSSATHIYPNSRGLESFIVEEGFCPPEKIKVLGQGSSNGIDTHYFNPDHYSEHQKEALRQQLGIPREDLVFIFVGRMVGDKGIHELVEAFATLQAEKPGVSLLLVGPLEPELDPIHPETARLIEEHPKIHSVGFQQDVRPFFSIADVLTFPSYREGFPNVVMQAGAMGLPSIVSNINGCNEIIEEGVNGMIIKVKDKDALLKAMDTLVSDPSLRTKLTRQARRIICSRYERRVFWEYLLEEYQELEAQWLPATAG